MPSSCRTLTLGTLLAAGVVAAAACQRSAPAGAVPDRPLSDSAVAQLAFGVRHQLMTAGVRRGEIRADTAMFNDAGTRVDLRRVRFTLYSPAGDSIGAAVAPAATYDMVAQRVEMRGGVAISAPGGRRLSATALTYDAASGRFSGDGAAAFAGVGTRGPAVPRLTRPAPRAPAPRAPAPGPPAAAAPAPGAPATGAPTTATPGKRPPD
jgi:hypothetical protein